VGRDKDKYLRFERPIDGIRAIVILLRKYKWDRQINTLDGVAHQWLLGDHTEQEIALYANTLSKRSGFHIHKHIDLTRPSVLRAVTRAIIWAENSQDPYEAEYKTIFPRLK
jgi:hypothetical protein